MKIKQFALLFALLGLLRGAAAQSTDQPTQPMQPTQPTNPVSQVEPDADQTPAGESQQRLDAVDDASVQLRESGQPGVLLVDLGGFGLTLGRSYEAETWEKMRRQRFSFNIVGSYELGFTSLVGIRSTLPADTDAGDFPDRMLGSSFHFSFTPIGIYYHAGRQRHSTFQLGLQYAVDNLRLANPSATFVNDGRLLVPVASEESIGKSKLRYTTLGFVLSYDWRAARHLRLGLSTHYDLLLNAYAITKSPKQKERLAGFSDFRFGVGAQITYRCFGFFVRYTPTSLFDKSSGWKAQTISYGVAINL